MTETPQKTRDSSTNSGNTRLDYMLLRLAFTGNLTAIRGALSEGANVNAIHEQTGLSALHIAVGTNNLELTQYLIEEAGATIGPDRSGRWPTIIAAECEVDAVLSDYVLDVEANISGV
ncbi:hypothetical protein Nham_0594 [Nitrobacter hamburgensis X14]|uniref:Uncharacterized protein n=1 Tax=Nitrobacter hamburgensis (strain DSM 10229 / NCIMB 13809 / X14) TaxID=323097 RepID=Q1QQL4_NITHX|nr:ankyrin repeat domain-containing protein [Nitrobacter hamburgensis]ABE61483.1 hypothetical protein Nham_0594 [Nitrobacter hamburgensis X14]